MVHLITYWIEFDTGLGSQFGITAYSLKDALTILKQQVFLKQEVPVIKVYKENIKFQDLDQNHIGPNIGTITKRGIWFPIIYSF